MKVYLLSLVITILFIICSMILELKQIKCFDQWLFAFIFGIITIYLGINNK